MTGDVAGTLSIILAFIIAIVLYRVTGFDKKYVESEKIAIPLAFGGGALILAIILWKIATTVVA